MGKITGFLEFGRILPAKEDPKNRINHSREFVTSLSEDDLNNQAGRCMDCGVPFCQNGCPLGNVIPEFNDAVYNKDWQKALEILSGTNNFPEFTGRICPAPCESACVLDINKDPVTIEEIEKQIAEYGFAHGLIKPIKITNRTGKKIAVIGSGPAGLALASELNKYGHTVMVYERADKLGGLLRYGVPDFKLEKNIIDRRINLMEQEGIIFKTNVHVGVNLATKSLLDEYDAIALSIGATALNLLDLEKAQGTNGVTYAMEYLTAHNQFISDGRIGLNNHEGLPYKNSWLNAKGKHVVIIGGGDTGSDCIGTANRQGAASITQLDYAPRPPHSRCESTPWPNWPRKFRLSSSHEEGCTRMFSVRMKDIVAENNKIVGLKIVDLGFIKNDPSEVSATYQEIPDTIRIIPCDLLILAIGFKVSKTANLVNEFGLQFGADGKVIHQNFHTKKDSKVFIAGDARIGATLVVRAIAEGRECAKAINSFLSDQS
ncbi:MAG: gltD [Burkholderiales bacterium]|jgi:glutamate synthase (NADPH/NADH) small chain|nr:gltD [Burkholderiales bacterium]